MVGSTRTDNLSGNASDNGKRGYVLRNNCACTDHRAVAYDHPFPITAAVPIHTSPPILTGAYV